MTRDSTTVRWRLLRAGIALLATACVSEDLDIVSVEPAPAPATVVFALTDRSLFYGLTVTTCNGRVMWTLSNDRNIEPPAHITYGVAPDGFSSRTGPSPLTPGCYHVIVSGPSRARFEIGRDGRLAVPPTPKPS